MRILIVMTSFHPRWGGAENQARRQAADLIRRGHVVEVVTWRYDDAWPEDEVLDGVRIRRATRAVASPGQRLRSLLGMVRLMRGAVRAADVVAAHQLTAVAFLAGALGAVHRVPVVAKAANVASTSPSDLWRLSQPGIAGRLARLAAWPLRRWGIAIAISDEIERDLAALGFRRRVRINNGVVDPPLGDRHELRARLLAHLALPPAARLIVAAGRLRRQKGFDVLLAAWPRVGACEPNAVLAIFGAGPEENALRAQVRELGLADSVRFVLPPPPEEGFLRAADVVVIPSRYEGMSNVLLEAMVAATPVVATAVSGAVDLLVDGKNGRLVPVDDVPSLADAIITTLRSPDGMGAAARETVLARCEMSRVVDLYECVFFQARSLPPGLTTAERLLQYPRPNASAPRHDS